MKLANNRTYTRTTPCTIYHWWSISAPSMCVVRTMIYTDHTYIHVLYLIAPSFYSDGNVGRRYCCGIATCNCAGALMKVLHAAQLPLNEIPPHHRPLICTATRSMHWLLHSRMQLIQRLHTGWWTRPIYIYPRTTDISLSIYSCFIIVWSKKSQRIVAGDSMHHLGCSKWTCAHCS